MATSSAEKARVAVKAVYDNQTWSKRVDKMTDDQVTAIYMRLKAQGKF